LEIKAQELAKTIHQSIENGTMPIEVICEMLADSLEANALFMSLFQSEQEEINGAVVLDEFVMTSNGMLTGKPLTERLIAKYVKRKQRRLDTLQLALKLLIK